MNAGVVVESLRPPQVSVGSSIRTARPAALLVVAITLLAAVLRFARIGHQSFWYDESFTVLLVHHSPSEMLGLLPQTELTPPLYYCLAWPWARIFGYGEVALRSLSALAGVATIPAIYGAGAKLISRRAGLTAAALAACNPLLIWYSQEARSYALLVLFASLSLLAFAHVRLPQPTPRALGAWALAACLALGTHYYGALAVAPQGAWLVWVHRRESKVLLTVAGVAALGLALLPLALSQRPQASWIAAWPLDHRLSQIVPQFVLGTGAPARGWLKLAGAAAVLLAAIMLARRANVHERRGALVSGVLGASGIVLSVALILLGTDELITRNVIVVLIPATLVISAGLGARRAGRPGLAGAATICTVGVVAAVGVAVDTDLQRPDWRALSHAIGAHRPTGAGRAILLQRHVFLMPLALDMPGLRFLKPQGARVNELDVIAISVPPNGWFCWWGSACNLLASKLDTSISVPGFHRHGPVLHVNQFSILRLRSAAPVRLTQSQIARALKKAPFKSISPPHPKDVPRGVLRNGSYGLLVQPPR